MERGGMCTRGGHRALRVARTIVDLSGQACVAARALGEALQYGAAKPGNMCRDERSYGTTTSFRVAV